MSRNISLPRGGGQKCVADFKKENENMASEVPYDFSLKGQCFKRVLHPDTNINISVGMHYTYASLKPYSTLITALTTWHSIYDY